MLLPPSPAGEGQGGACEPRPRVGASSCLPPSLLQHARPRERLDSPHASDADAPDAAGIETLQTVDAMAAPVSLWGYDGDARGFELLDAAGDGNIDTVERLLKEAPGEVEAHELVVFREPGERWTALHYAANNGHAACAETLAQAAAQHGAELLQLRTRLGDTPLHLCCLFGHVEIARMLLRLAPRADDACRLVSAANNSRETPLHKAAFSGSAELCETLCLTSVRSGGTLGWEAPKARTDWGGTPLHYAAMEGQGEAYHTLLLRGAEAEALDFKGRRAWDLADADMQAWVLDRGGRARAGGSATLHEVIGRSSKAGKLQELGSKLAEAGDDAAALQACTEALLFCAPPEPDPVDVPEDYTHGSFKSGSARRGVPAEDPDDPDAKRRKFYTSFELVDDLCETRERALHCLAELGCLHLHASKPELAALAAELALRLQPQDLQAVCVRGLARLDLAELAQAEEDLQQVKAGASWQQNIKVRGLRRLLARSGDRLRHARAAEAELARRMLGLGEEGGLAAEREPAGQRPAVAEGVSGRTGAAARLDDLD